MKPHKELINILKSAIANDAADIILKANCKPMFLIRGEAVAMAQFPEYDSEAVKDMLFSVLKPHQIKKFETELEQDISLDIPELARFRVNLFYEQGRVGSVMRAISNDILTFESLALHPILKQMVMEKEGLILVTGPTGSGKTTTLASMIDYVNQLKPGHIVTIEDPIEVIYKNKKAVITQREIGQDTTSFFMGLRAALRQAPSIILIGEMRDRETIEAALKAAETGHLVLSTLHTIDSVQTIYRILNAFPPNEQGPILNQLSSVLKGCIAQRLIPRSDRPERLAILDIMVVTSTVKEAIAKGEIDQIYEFVRKGAFDGMQSTNQALLNAYRSGMITDELALNYSPSPNEMLQLIRSVAREELTK